MDIEHKKRKDEDFFKSFYPIADDKVRVKTNAELELKTYKLHFYFARFAFAILSFALYLPTIIELFQTSYTITDYIRNFIIILILALLEIGLSFSLYDYYVRFHSQNKDRRRLIIYSLAFTSVVLSALSGVNAIDIVDKSESNIISETQIIKENDIKKYMEHIDRNLVKIDDADKRIAVSNQNIKDLAPVAVTKKGSAQIVAYQEQNATAAGFIDRLSKQNSHLLLVVEDIRRESKSLMKTRITKAGKKELIYMVIFFISGIVAVGGLMYSYNFIGMFYRHVKDDALNIEVLRKQLDEEEEAYQESLQLKSDRKMDDNIRRQERLNQLEQLKKRAESPEISYFAEKKKHLQ